SPGYCLQLKWLRRFGSSAGTSQPAGEGGTGLRGPRGRRLTCPGLSGIERDYSPLSLSRDGVEEDLDTSGLPSVLVINQQVVGGPGIMRQAVEAQVVTPPFELGEQGLRQILSDVIEEVRRSVSQDIDGAEVLHSLLTASWLQSLLKVYECLQRHLTDCPAPALDFASGLSLQLLVDIRSLPYCSEEAKELYHLLRQPHMQALLSAHDTVAQKDYEPVLPPMPDELPDDEEATRIVCLVKNKQPLPRRVLEDTSMEMSNQESLDKLRMTVQQAASSMESSSKDIRVLGERMVAATDRMTETVQSLVLLTQVVDRLQTLLTTTRTDIKISHAEQSGCSSSSSASSLDAPSTSTGPSPITANHQGPPLTTVKTGRRSPGDPDVSIGLLTNGELELTKTADNGATIKRNDITGEIFVARVIHGGLADRSGLLHAGDRIIEVNGFPVDGMEPEQVIQVVQARSHGTIMFKVIPITERPIHNQTMLYVRAMTDYNPQQDPTIPCADAGMSFNKGDILEIVDQTDALWWQAKKLPGSSACAGLIPSTNLLKRKQREFWWSQPYQPHVCMQILSTVDEEEDLMAIDERCVEAEEDDFSSNIEGVYLAGFRRSIRLCRRRSQCTTQPSSLIRCPSNCSSVLNNPYEEVVRYQRHPEDTHRVIALIGSSGVGVNELRRRLIEMNSNIFQGAIPHTTRSPRGYEESGREYYFTSREIFDHMISNNRFLEFGEYKGNLYGTSVDAVKDVLNSGKICVVDIEPNAVRTHELRAYIIYVKPPPLERLRETRQDSYITTNYYVNRPFKDEDFHEMEESARKMEAQYWQFFDQVIVNDELQDSCVQLLTAVRKAQDEPQWVPACWIRPTAES
ncbi:hypothetical protein CCH79_00013404, partial [Gambusia affinis]